MKAIRALLLALAALMLPGCAGAPIASQIEAGSSPTRLTVPYSVAVVGVRDPTLCALLERSSQLFALKNDPPASVAGLTRRADSDLDRFNIVLRSEGYYASLVTYEFDRSASPTSVTMQVQTGPSYALAAYQISFTTPISQPERVPTQPRALGLTLGARAQAAEIVSAEQRLQTALGNAGHPFARVDDRATVVDHAAHTLSVTLRIDPGAAVTFGPLTVEGLQAVAPDYVTSRATWTEGSPFDQSKVEDLRVKLLSSGLFATVAVAAKDAVAETVPIRVTVTEAAHRSIGAGIAYATNEGAEATAFWEHRNMLGRGERLRLSATLGQLLQGVLTEFRRPAFLRPDQDLAINLRAERRDTDAFHDLRLAALAAVERKISPFWTASLGISADVAKINDAASPSRSYLLGVPAGLRLDTTNSPLDATEGAKVSLSLSPFVGDADNALTFAQGDASIAAFYALDAAGRFVVAGRARLGATIGAALLEIPANRRFFAGGGGSIRAYAFQHVGPRGVDGAPLGGRSLAELGGELRIKLTETIGIVPFVEAGNAFEGVLPDLSQGVRTGAGIGLRYYTGFGPIRVDLAAPLDKRRGDDDFQFYVSFGQAF